MQESDLNRVINKSFRQIGFSHKMQDPPKAVATTFGKNPFDGFSVFDGKAVYWESKLVKGYKALAFASIRDHQIEALTEISKQSGDSGSILPIILWGIYEPRRTKKILAFHIDFVLERMANGEKSIKKVEVERLVEDGWSVDVRKEYCDAKELVRKVSWPKNSGS